MDENKGIEVLTKMRECEDIDFCDSDCFKCRLFAMDVDRTNALNMAIKALDKDTNVPTKWIPCSERLPETEEAYTDCMGFEDGDLSKPISPLTCYESDPVLAYGILDECSEGRQIFVATYAEWKHHETGKIETGWRDNVCGDDCKVLAWMPLPEPYKEGEQHETD